MDKHRNLNDSTNYSFVYLLTVISLVIWGLIVMYSASYHEALIHGLPHYYFVLNQFKFFIFALFAAFFIKIINFKFIEYMIYPLMILSFICMLLTIFTPYGVSVLGAKRWLKLGPIPSFQPSELVKVSTILFIARYYSTRHKKDIIAFSIVLVNAFLILMQKDYSTTMLYLFSNFLFLLVCGCDFKKIFIGGMFLIFPAIYAILSEPFRVKRIVSFLNPSLDPSGINYQINNSLAAINRGGLFGVGLGNGIYKLGKLPEVQNDFIFSSLTEETGFIGVVFTLILFYIILKMGFKIAKRLWNENLFKSYICFGISVSIAIQLVINVLVVTGMIPPTGIPLPFISQGGTNLFFTLVETSIVYKIIKEDEINLLASEELIDESLKDVFDNSVKISDINIGTDFTNYTGSGCE